jgi:excisionase family DNA binding protein
MENNEKTKKQKLIESFFADEINVSEQTEAFFTTNDENRNKFFLWVYKELNEDMDFRGSFTLSYMQLLDSLISSLIKDAYHSVISEAKQPELQNPDELLTVQQAAELLNLSVATLYGYTQRAEIPVCKRGKRLYFSKQNLIEWVKQGKKKTLAEIAHEADNYLITKKKEVRYARA